MPHVTPATAAATTRAHTMDSYASHLWTAHTSARHPASSRRLHAAACRARARRLPASAATVRVGWGGIGRARLLPAQAQVLILNGCALRVQQMVQLGLGAQGRQDAQAHARALDAQLGLQLRQRLRARRGRAP
jgi:hypothetical protein